MKKSEIPQDKSALEHFTREVCYVKNDDGRYETGLSEGWEAKKVALDNAWDEVERRIEQSRLDVVNGKVSPIVYFMEKNLMDLTVLKGYTGFWGWTIKRHFSPGAFAKLTDSTLAKYAAAFEIPVATLKNFKG